jgi:hypothetical protein
MTRPLSALAAMLVAGVVAGARPAQAAPPTVTPSPGYDARLQEQRKATSPAVARPAAPVTTNVTHHPRKRKH